MSKKVNLLQFFAKFYSTASFSYVSFCASIFLNSVQHKLIKYIATAHNISYKYTPIGIMALI